VFGDSWPAGAELFVNEKSYTFPNVLGKLLGMNTVNLSRDGSSIDESVFYLLDYFQRSEILKHPDQYSILFCLTSYSRLMMITSNQEVTQMLPSAPHSEKYYKYFYSEDNAKFNLVRNLILVQHICESNNIPIYFVFNWDESPSHILLNNDKIYYKTLVEILGMDRNTDLTTQFNSCEYIGQCHPNIEGHKLIAEELSKWIN
jgi:hypothetical protein